MIEAIQVGALSLRFLLNKDETYGGLDLFEMMLPPQARMPLPHHHRDWDETVYGLEGVTHWTLDGVGCALGPGDRLFIRRGVVHGFLNRSEAPSRCLCILTPGVLGPAYFREIGAELASHPAPDPERMRRLMERYGLFPAAPEALR